MKISTKGRYALRMLLDIAENGSDRYVSLKEVAVRQNLSKKYLEQIIPIFSHSGMLLISRGAQGGYRLAKKPCEYSVGDILRLAEGSLAPVSCLDDEQNGAPCERREQCLTYPVWQGLYILINRYFDRITLQDILDNDTLSPEKFLKNI